LFQTKLDRSRKGGNSNGKECFPVFQISKRYGSSDPRSRRKKEERTNKLFLRAPSPSSSAQFVWTGRSGPGVTGPLPKTKQSWNFYFPNPKKEVIDLVQA
jgi:hypothetical protein